MAESYKVLYEETTAEIIEKKSRFIAFLKPVNSEEEAAQFIDSIKKMNWNASHNCSAAVVGRNNEYSRCSDDGEPSGTAGKPMLEVLLGEGIHNTAVVVTRYFGGTLLGTGGLVRAYQRCVKEGLAAAHIMEKYSGYQITVHTDYNGIGKIQYIIGQMDIFTIDTEYAQAVTVKIAVQAEESERFIKKVTEATNGQAEIEKSEELFFVLVNGEVIL